MTDSGDTRELEWCDQLLSLCVVGCCSLFVGCWLVKVVDWCWLVLVGVGWCWLMLIGVDCVVLVGVDKCCLVYTTRRSLIL